MNTIVLNRHDGPQGPFNPEKQLVLKEYLKYDNKFRAIDPSIRVCP